MSDVPPISQDEQDAWDKSMWEADVEREQGRSVSKRLLLIAFGLIVAVGLIAAAVTAR